MKKIPKIKSWSKTLERIKTCELILWNEQIKKKKSGWGCCCAPGRALIQALPEPAACDNWTEKKKEK